MTPTDEIVEVQAGKWKTRVLSAGEGDPVVFLHGFAGLWWDPFLDRLAERYRVVAPQHLGSGASQGVEHLEDIVDLVLYYCELFDVLGLPAASVIGHCFGGMVAAEMASISPERINKLVLAAPLGLWLDDHPIPDISTITPSHLPGMLLADPSSTAASMLPQTDPGDPEALLQASMAMAGVLQFTWPLPDKGLRRRLYRVKAETLLVWGRQDHLVDPVYGQAFAAALRNARLEVVDGAGHLPQLERPSQMLSLTTDFLG